MRPTFVIFKIEDNSELIILSLWTMANNYQNHNIKIAHFVHHVSDTNTIS